MITYGLCPELNGCASCLNQGKSVHFISAMEEFGIGFLRMLWLISIYSEFEVVYCYNSEQKRLIGIRTYGDETRIKVIKALPIKKDPE